MSASIVQSGWENQVRHPIQILLVALVSLSMLHCPSVSANEVSSDEYSPGDSVPLGQDELREITAQVLSKEPLLSSSAGIKFADARRSVRSTDTASIIYHPHTESAGIKQAFQVVCSRQVPHKTWTCDDPEIRRYLALDSQDYEVRITGPIGSFEAIALIEATKKALPYIANDGIAVPKTAIMILSYDGSYLVTWGDSKGHSELMMQARLPEGGDPAQSNDWQVSVFEYGGR